MRKKRGDWGAFFVNASMMRSAFFRFSSELRSRWPFVTIVVLGLALLLTNLGTDYLWADEGDTAVLASGILKFGVSEGMGWRHLHGF
jgi:hypothetical protein